ncbi:MAG: hypothetical protein ACM3US_01600 [Sphingomonadaceae bacterium]
MVVYLEGVDAEGGRGEGAGGQQYQLLDEYARTRGMTVNPLLRESLERGPIASLERRREAALARLAW